MRIISVWHITTVTMKVMLLLPGLVPGRERSFEMDIKKFQEGLLALKNKKQQKGLRALLIQKDTKRVTSKLLNCKSLRALLI